MRCSSSGRGLVDLEDDAISMGRAGERGGDDCCHGGDTYWNRGSAAVATGCQRYLASGVGGKCGWSSLMPLRSSPVSTTRSAPRSACRTSDWCPASWMSHGGNWATPTSRGRPCVRIARGDAREPCQRKGACMDCSRLCSRFSYTISWGNYKIIVNCVYLDTQVNRYFL